jgi:hypothetical protein
MGGYTRAVSGQRLDKHVPAAIDTNVSIEEQWSGVFYMVRAEMLISLELSSVWEDLSA